MLFHLCLSRCLLSCYSRLGVTVEREMRMTWPKGAFDFYTVLQKMGDRRGLAQLHGLFLPAQW